MSARIYRLPCHVASAAGCPVSNSESYRTKPNMDDVQFLASLRNISEEEGDNLCTIDGEVHSIPKMIAEALALNERYEKERAARLAEELRLDREHREFDAHRRRLREDYEKRWRRSKQQWRKHRAESQRMQKHLHVLRLDFNALKKLLLPQNDRPPKSHAVYETYRPIRSIRRSTWTTKRTRGRFPGWDSYRPQYTDTFPPYKDTSTSRPRNSGARYRGFPNDHNIVWSRSERDDRSWRGISTPSGLTKALC
jgi:hypothetical protein